MRFIAATITAGYGRESGAEGKEEEEEGEREEKDSRTPD